VDEAGDLEVRAEDVFRYAGESDYVKLDIEGAEWAILHDPRFPRLAPVVALEYHPHMCPTPDPDEHARRALDRAGYRWADAEFDSPRGHGMIWAWKPK